MARRWAKVIKPLSGQTNFLSSLNPGRLKRLIRRFVTPLGAATLSVGSRWQHAMLTKVRFRALSTSCGVWIKITNQWRNSTSSMTLPTSMAVPVMRAVRQWWISPTRPSRFWWRVMIKTTGWRLAKNAPGIKTSWRTLRKRLLSLSRKTLRAIPPPLTCRLFRWGKSVRANWWLSVTRTTTAFCVVRTVTAGKAVLIKTVSVRVTVILMIWSTLCRTCCAICPTINGRRTRKPAWP